MQHAIELVCHSATPPHKVRSVAVGMKRTPDGFLFLAYAVEPADTLLLPDHPWGARSRLWESTCFELFLKTQAGGYCELNFAPTFAWYAQSFSSWRRGKPLDLPTPPHLVDCRVDDRRPGYPGRYELDVVLSPALLENVSKLSLTAVIEETDGTISYWALAHPPGDKPDFHHPACFVLELPPPSAA
jgi:hypothetical protein